MSSPVSLSELIFLPPHFWGNFRLGAPPPPPANCNYQLNQLRRTDKPKRKLLQHPAACKVLFVLGYLQSLRQVCSLCEYFWGTILDYTALTARCVFQFSLA